ncbi:hypothetical protein [Sphingomonas sp.]
MIGILIAILSRRPDGGGAGPAARLLREDGGRLQNEAGGALLLE